MRLKRTGILTKIVIVALLVYAMVSLVRLNIRKAEATQQLDELTQQQADLAAEKDKLQTRIENSDDDETIREIAKEDLGYLDSDEEIYGVG